MDPFDFELDLIAAIGRHIDQCNKRTWLHGSVAAPVKLPDVIRLRIFVVPGWRKPDSDVRSSGKLDAELTPESVVAAAAAYRVVMSGHPGRLRVTTAFPRRADLTCNFPNLADCSE